MKLKLQITNDEWCPGGPCRTVRRRVPAPFVIRGFTLLELLLAVMIFAVVLSALHVVFFTAFKLRNKTTENIERGLPLQQTLAIIKRDLANLAPPGGPLSGLLQSTPTATSSGSMSASMNGQGGPQFYTAVGIVDDSAPWGEIERVSYTLSPATQNTPGQDLHRMVTRNLLPASQADTDDQYLMSGVESLAFQFYDGNAWRDTWDSTQADTLTGLTNNLPRAIKLQLRLYNDNRSMGAMEPVELIVPVMVQARTNVTSDTTGGAQ
jgi:general secretion pathway protein J